MDNRRQDSLRKQIPNNCFMPGSVLLLVLGLLICLLSRGNSSFDHNLLTVGCLISYCFCLIAWVKSGNRLISLYVVFVMYMMFSSLGQSIVFLVAGQRLITSGFSSLFANHSFSSICNMLRFQLLCVCCFAVGTSIFVYRDNHCISRQELSRWYSEKQENNNTIDYIFDIIMYLSFVGVASYCMYIIASRQSMSYAEFYTSDSRQVASQVPAFLAIILGIRSVMRKRHVSLVYFSWICFIAIYFICGTRSMAIIYVGALIATVPITHSQLFQRKFALFWIFGVLFGFASLSMLTVWRTTSLGNSTFSFNLIENLWSTVNEMGISARPTIVTMEYIDSGGKHYQTILYELFHGFFPTSILEMIGGKDWGIKLGKWIQEVSGESILHQLGYSCIAESYMNYGWFGCLFMGVYGWFIAYVENKSYKKMMHGKYWYAIAMLSILCRQIFFARAQLNLVDTFYRYSCYMFMLWIVYQCIANKAVIPIDHGDIFWRKEE